MKSYCKTLVFTLWVAIFLILLSQKVFAIESNIKEEVTDRTLEEKFTAEEATKFANMKKPDQPDQIPEDVRFMQKELIKSYNLAYKTVYPRFAESKVYSKKFQELFPEDKREIFEIDTSSYSGETTVPINNSWSNSVYIMNWLFWTRTYPAMNAVYGRSYWCSNGGHGKDDIIIWEAQFNDLTRVHGINIVWAYAPGRYAIEYSNDGTNYKTLINWKDSIKGGTSTWWSNLTSIAKGPSKSFPDRITFPSPVFVRKIRILMKNPVNNYFGIYRVDIFVKNWVLLIKNVPDGQCEEECWVVNTLNPIPGTLVKIIDCVGTIGYSENRELFVLLFDGRLLHYNSGLCVVTAENKTIYLEDCTVAKLKMDGRETYQFSPDGKITSNYAQDECVYKPTDTLPDDLVKDITVEASSTMSDGNHYAAKAIDGNEASAWISYPGDTITTFTLYFKEWTSMDNLLIEWKYKPTDFEIFVFTLEQGWRHLLKIKNNKDDKSDLSLRRINARAVQVKLNKTKQKYLNLPIYGISGVKVNDGGINMARQKCAKLTETQRSWQLDNQWYYFVGNKEPYVKEMNTMTTIYLQLKKLNREINLKMKVAAKAYETAKELSIVLSKTGSAVSDLLKEIKKFKTENYGKKNIQFDDALGKFGREPFYPYVRSNKGKDTNAEQTQIGAVSLTPAKDCWHIKQLIPVKKSGFYWIKPICSRRALRVFCDFSINGLGTSIYAWQSTSNINNEISDHQIIEVNDVRKGCASIGLEPIQLNNADTVNRIVQFVRISGWDLSGTLVIPLGHDYGCDSGTCSSVFNSMNTKDSPILSQLFLSPDPDLSSFNKGLGYNTLGLGFNKFGKPNFFNLKTAKVTALICSTNQHAPALADPAENPLECGDILNGNSKIDGAIGSKVKISCPAFCVEKADAKVYGENSYSDISSVCRAALHNGAITNEDGGIFVLIIGPGLAEFGEIIKNNIKSFLGKKSIKSFSIKKIKPVCPIDFFKSETGDKLNPEKEAAEEKKVDVLPETPKAVIPESPTSKIPFSGKIGGKPSSYEAPETMPIPEPKEGLNAPSNEGMTVNKAEAALDGIKVDPTKKDTAAKDVKVDLAAAAKLALNNNSVVQNEAEKMKAAMDPNNNPTMKAAEKAEMAKKTPCNVTTDKCTDKILKFRDLDYKVFKYYTDFAKAMGLLLKDFRTEISFSVYPGKLSNKHFNILFNKLTKISENLENVYVKLRGKCEQRLENTKKMTQYLSRLTAGTTNFGKIQTDYAGKIEEQFDIFTYKTSKIKGNWQFSDSNLEGRAHAIHQNSKAASDRFGTFLLPMGKIQYDFDFQVEVLTRSNGNFAFEINQTTGSKKMIKMKNGVKTELISVNDGGISQNNWFKVLIEARKGKFVIRSGESKTYRDFTAAPIVFKFEDHDFAHGHSGLYTNGNEDFYADNLKIDTIDCQTKWDVIPGRTFITDSASFYIENFQLAFDLEYDVYNPNTTENGPAKWSFTKNLYERPVLLRQNSRIKDSGIAGELSLAIIKSIFIRKKAFFKVDYRASNSGVVGFVFKYLDNDNYFLFEIGGGDDVTQRYLQVRKKLTGVWSLIKRYNKIEEISSLPFFGYDTETWYEISIELLNESIKIFGGIKGTTKEILIFEFSDNSIPYGRVGFATSGTEAVFANINVYPTPIIYSEREIPSTFTEAVITNDVLLLEFFSAPIPHIGPSDSPGNGKNAETGTNNNGPPAPAPVTGTGTGTGATLPKKRVVNPPTDIGKGNFVLWKQCVKLTTLEERSDYCKTNFKVSAAAQVGCLKKFCRTCCEKNIPIDHKTDLYHCSKKCNLASKASLSTVPSSETQWRNACISNANPDKNIYKYCETSFGTDKEMLKNCQIDSCRLCCAVHDQAFKNTEASIETEGYCFKACEKKFP